MIAQKDRKQKTRTNERENQIKVAAEVLQSLYSHAKTSV